MGMSTLGNDDDEEEYNDDDDNDDDEDCANEELDETYCNLNGDQIFEKYVIPRYFILFLNLFLQ